MSILEICSWLNGAVEFGLGELVEKYGYESHASQSLFLKKQ